MTKKAEYEARVAANKRAAYVKRVNTLVGFLFGRVDMTALNAAFDAGTSADEYAASIAAKSPVGAAVHPLKVEAVARARKMAEARIEKVRADLEKHGMDLEQAAPRPHWRNSGRPEYKDELAKNGLYSRLTRPVKSYVRDGEPDIREMSAESIARFIASNEEDAAVQYDMFICKLVSKVGECESATIDGSHVWGNSILTVTKKGGKVERWKTQQIVNVSVLGNYFNQWPTRLMK